MGGAPRLLDRLDPDDAEHFGTVRELLDRAGLKYEIEPTLVRGLDYYTRTLFEFSSDALGAQSGVAGGGRYDRLIEQLDGPSTAACGWAAGVERMLLAAGELPTSPPITDLYVAILGSGGPPGRVPARPRGRRRAGSLRSSSSPVARCAASSRTRTGSVPATSQSSPTGRRRTSRRWSPAISASSPPAT